MSHSIPQIIYHGSATPARSRHPPIHIDWHIQVDKFLHRCEATHLFASPGSGPSSPARLYAWHALVGINEHHRVTFWSPPIEENVTVAQANVLACAACDDIEPQEQVA
jgi:hypothetical protein